MKSRKKTKSRVKPSKPPKRKAGGTRAAAKVAKPAKAKTPGKTNAPDTLDPFILGGARGLALRIEKSWMKAVRTNLRVTLDLATMVAEFPLPDDAEPAPVFRA